MVGNVLLQTASTLDNWKLLLLFAVVTAVILIDYEFGNIADFIPEIISSTEGITLFVGTAVIFVITSLIILAYVRHISEKSGAKFLHLARTHKLVTIAQYTLIVIVAITVLQVLATMQYSILSLAASLTISYGLWIVTMILLARAFFTWYKSIASHNESQSKILILILGLSMVVYVINGGSGLANSLLWLQEQNPIIASQDVAFYPDFESESLISQVGAVNQLSSTVAFILTWISTIILLRPYMEKIGKVKFWGIMGFALVYLISYPLYLLGFLSPTGETDAEIMNNIILVSTASVFAGLVFGAAFLSIARTLRRGTAIRQYLILAGYGMFIFYLAGSATVSQAAYPPYGLISVGFTGLSTYLIYVGLYSSAVTLSQDLTLRKTIRKSVLEQSKLLDSIATAQMEKELQTSVLTIVKKTSQEMKDDSGIEASLTEEDLRDYMGIVMNELKSVGNN
jgi:hypothetical protein